MSSHPQQTDNHQGTTEDLGGVFTPCRTGKHLWYFEEDAAKCCAGFHRILVFDPDEADTWLHLFGFGYKWVPGDPPAEEVLSEN